MTNDKSLGIIGIIVLGIVAICFFAYLIHSSRQVAPLTTADIQKAREIVRRLESG